MFGERRLVRLAQLGGAVALALAAAIASAHPAAADHGGQRPTLADIVAQSQLIVVARVSVDRDGITLDVERVLKGDPVEALVFPPTDQKPPLDGWKRAVFAFTDQTTLDTRAPTMAWNVADDGILDPEGFQPTDGLPATLDELIAAFGQGPVEPAVALGLPLAAPQPDDNPSAIFAALIAVGIGLLGALVLGQRWREAQ
jgi:hypothetical protein